MKNINKKLLKEYRDYVDEHNKGVKERNDKKRKDFNDNRSWFSFDSFPVVHEEWEMHKSEEGFEHWMLFERDL